MKLLYNGIEIGSIITDSYITVEEALDCMGYNIKNQDDLKKAYEEKFPAAYQDDDGLFQIDLDGINMEF